MARTLKYEGKGPSLSQIQPHIKNSVLLNADSPDPTDIATLETGVDFSLLAALVNESPYQQEPVVEEE